MSEINYKQVHTVSKFKIVSKSFKLIDFHVYDEFVKEQKPDKPDPTKSIKQLPNFIIQMFGVNEKGETCSISIPDYEPFFYIKISNDFTNSDIQSLKREFMSSLGYQSKSILSIELVESNKLYEFSAGKQFKFAKIIFQNTIALNKIKNLWYFDDIHGQRTRKNYKFKNCSLELYESNIPPLLRYFHIHNISPSGWIKINTKFAQQFEDNEKTTNCDFEYSCSLCYITPLPQKETSVPYKICSFDIEASSSHGDFPVPIKSYKRLSSNIVDIFKKQIYAYDTSKCTLLINKIIMTAFGYDKFEEVDLVYPKIKPSKSELTNSIQSLINETIVNAKKKNSENNSKFITIDKIFSKMNTKNNGYCDDGDNGDGDGEDCDNDCNDGENDEDDDEPSYKKSKSKSKNIKISSNTTILDVLQNNEYDRETKIQYVNEVFTTLIENHVFPELEGDKVTFIGSTFLNYGENTPYLNHCLVLGSCDPLEGAIIESTDTEKDLLLKWTELIQYETPDIII